MFLITSNASKRAEFESLGLNIDIRSGMDIKEVDADHETVAIYKALEAGIGAVIDDTILIFNGEEVVDVRWRIQELVTMARDTQPCIEWVVLLAHNTGTEVRLYKASVTCEVDDRFDINNPPSDGFAFDPFLRPQGQTKTFYELEREGVKLEHSPRGLAIRAMVNGQVHRVQKIADIPAWTGAYQNS
jgi:inosine/xanthosine triphosphate pyrophosphatase family protein